MAIKASTTPYWTGNDAQPATTSTHYPVLQDEELRAVHALCDLSFPGSSVTLSSDTPTIPSGFAEVENHSPPTSAFDGMQQHQYRTEVNTFSAVLLLKPSSLTI